MDARREEHINAAVDASVPSAARSLCAAHLVHTFIHTARLRWQRAVADDDERSKCE